MKKIILIILFQIILLSWVGATQNIVELSWNETKYIDPYYITNKTSNSIMAPYTDTNWNIWWNFFNNITRSITPWINFWTNLSSVIDYWSFEVGNAWYSISYWAWNPCSVSCWWWTKARYLSCLRTDWTIVNWSLCWLTSSWEAVSCNTQVCTSPCTNYSKRIHNGSRYATDFNCRAWATVRIWQYAFIGWCGWWARASTSCTTIPSNALSVSLSNYDWIARAVCNYTQCVAVNWSCWTTNNSCTAWTLSDIADSSTQYLWKCNWLYGWSTASCSLNKPVCTAWWTTDCVVQ